MGGTQDFKRRSIKTSHTTKRRDIKVKQEKIDHCENSKLNSRKLTHKTKFCEKLEELIDSTELQCIINENFNLLVSNEILEQIDEQITFVLNKAR